MSTCKFNFASGDEGKSFFTCTAVRCILKLNLLYFYISSRLIGLVDSTVARVHVNSVSAWSAEVARKFIEQPGDSHRTDCLRSEDHGTKFKLRRSGGAYSQLRSGLGRVQGSESRPLYYGHAETRNDCW